MDYYIKCAEVIIYRNQYVLRCNKCHNLFLALESFIQHFDGQHRRTDGHVSPCSKVYIDRTVKNESFDSYEDDHDNSLIEKVHETSKVKVKVEQTTLVGGDSQLENKPTVSQFAADATKCPQADDVPAKFIVSIPKCNLRHPTTRKELQMPTICSDDDSDEDYELDSLSSCNSSLDAAPVNLGDTAYGNENKLDADGRKRKSTRRFRWHEEERNAIYEYFGDLKILKRLPSLRQCYDAIQIYPALSKRTAPQVKSWIDNQRRYKLT